MKPVKFGKFVMEEMEATMDMHFDGFEFDIGGVSYDDATHEQQQQMVSYLIEYICKTLKAAEFKFVGSIGTEKS